MKITHKLLFGFAAITLMPLLIVSVIGIRQQSRIINRLSIVDAIDIATTIEQSISVELKGSSLHSDSNQLQNYVARLADTTKRDIAVVNTNKIILADIAEEVGEIGKEFIHDKGEIKQTMQDGTPRVFREISTDVPRGVHLVVVPLYHRTEDKVSDNIIGAVVISYEPADLAGLKFTLLFIVLVVIAMVIVTGLLLSRSIYKPILRLKAAVVEIGKCKLDTRIDSKSKDEIGELSRAFNKMVQDLRITTTSIENLNREVAERKLAQAEQQKLNTELGRMNQELQVSNEKLETANNDLKNFVYIASHDLREPLRKVSMFGAMLADSLKDKLTGTDAENLHFMIDGTCRMTQMIEGLLAYSRVSTLHNPFQLVDVNEIVRQLCEVELSVVLEEKKAVVDVPQPLAAVEADPVQIRQLMQNFIANGIKYQPKGATPKITITSKPAADNMMRIEVADNGIGIKPEYHAAIFEMFKRLHSRAEYEGTGIGLAVCKRIVDRHGGTIGVESQFGHGSTFWFTVPSVKVPLAV